MRLLAFINVSDLERAIAFYTALGLTLETRGRGGRWAELRAGDGLLGLHQLDRPLDDATDRIQLCFDAPEPLEGFATRLVAAGIPVTEPIIDEAFGRMLLLHDPDGLPVRIIAHDRELYT